MKKVFTVSEAEQGQRVDKFLAGQMPEFSRNKIQCMGKSVENSRRLHVGDVVEIETKDKEEGTIITEFGIGLKSLSYLYEDDDIIVVDKPRGMVMYPAAGNSSGTLVQELSRHCRLSPIGGSVRPGVVHRIDKDTSGAVVLAKSDTAFRALVKTFSEHSLIRKYIAFVWGVPAWKAADIEGNIAQSSRDRHKMSLVKVGGKPAKTAVEVIGTWARPGISQLRCSLFTGRTHQIRVHLATRGFGVVSDPIYGRGREAKIKPSALLDFLRGHFGQCLHAEFLELAHPVSGKPMKFHAPLSEDLRELIECLEKY